VLREIVDDALQMTRACALPVNSRNVLRTILLTDSFPFMVMMRMRESLRRHRIPLLNRALRYTQMTVFGIEVGKDVQLGRGVYFVHTLGTVVGGDSRLGDRVRVMGSNTIGTAKDNGCPIIDDDVVIGCGARILGPIRIGARAQIGANAVVLHDVPADAIATGIPAVIRMRQPGEQPELDVPPPQSSNGATPRA
jgi:serine O-acetyltransferase